MIVALALVASSCSHSLPVSHAQASGLPSLRSARRVSHHKLVPRVAAWSLPQAISREIALEQNGAVVVLGGLGTTGSSTASISVVTQGQSRREGALARPAHDAGGAVLSGKLFVFGGGETTTIDTVQRVSQSAGNVVSLTVGHLPQPRSDLEAVTINNAAYIVGGFDGSRLLPDVLRTTDGIHFTKITSLRQALRYGATAASGNIIYVFGGTTGSTELNSIQSINTITGRAQIVARLSHPVSHASAVMFAGSIYVLGGRSGGMVSNDVLRFDPTSRKIETVARLPYGVADGAAVALTDRILILGGETGAQRKQTARVIEMMEE
jgi:hypothetical protein